MPEDEIIIISSSYGKEGEGQGAGRYRAAVAFEVTVVKLGNVAHERDKVSHR